LGASDVHPDTKAIKITANSSRRSADVLVATEFLRYSSFPGVPASGVCFFTSSNQRIVNYPRQHSANCTAKHQATRGWFKPMVRILKNMRTRLVDDGLIQEGIAPSYFLEGLLYNVPNDKFGQSYGDTFVAAINWIRQADRNNFVCANEQYYLVRDSVPTCWPSANYDHFLNAVSQFWTDWS
jgi:hypothetical protein